MKWTVNDKKNLCKYWSKDYFLKICLKEILYQIYVPNKFGQIVAQNLICIFYFLSESHNADISLLKSFLATQQKIH